MDKISADVCVVGSGAGGAVMAKELAESGLHVVVLEKGERLSKYDLTQKESEMFPKLYEDAGLRATHDQSVIVLHAKGVGGTTIVNDNICFRAADFVLKEWQRLGIDDISPAHMQAYYEKVEQEISVTQIKEAEVSRNDQTFHRGAERLGLNPNRFNHNRVDCIGCGLCYCGCSYDRKRSMDQTYIPKAEAAKAQILANTKAEIIERDRAKILGVVASQCDPETKQEIKKIHVQAKLYVLAGGAISTPILLLKNGFGRLNANVGKHLGFHPISASIGLLDNPIHFYDGIPQCEYVDKLSPQDGGGFLLEGIGAHPILTSFIVPFLGRRHKEIMENFDRFTVHYVMIKDRPQGEIRVSKNGKIGIYYWLHKKDQESMREGLKLSAKIYFEAGAKKVYLNHVMAPVLTDPKKLDFIDRLPMKPNQMILYSAHQMSTCRMGTDPKTSVTDSFGRFHGMENLYISDASLFPTTIGYNPQLTIMALATRNAAFIASKLNKAGRRKSPAVAV